MERFRQDELNDKGNCHRVVLKIICIVKPESKGYSMENVQIKTRAGVGDYNSII